MLILIFGLILLSGLEFLGLNWYLKFSKKVSKPENITSKSQAIIGIAWLSLATYVGIIMVSGIKMVKYAEPTLNPLIGIIPVVVGFVISFFVSRSVWRDYSKKFQKK